MKISIPFSLLKIPCPFSIPVCRFRELEINLHAISNLLPGQLVVRWLEQFRWKVAHVQIAGRWEFYLPYCLPVRTSAYSVFFKKKEGFFETVIRLLPNSNFYIGIFQKDELKIVPAKKKFKLTIRSFLAFLLNWSAPLLEKTGNST